MLRQAWILLMVIFAGFTTRAQDTLPSFTLVNKGNNRIIVSWSNPYSQNIRQLSIQRSSDSTKNFKSILTVPDPTVPQNGFADNRATSPAMFYRLYILLDSGKYIFSKSKRPVFDTIQVKDPAREPAPAVQPVPETVKTEVANPATNTEKNDKKEIVKTEPVKPKEIPERMIYIRKRDTLLGQIGERSLRRYRDSIMVRTKDTVSFNTGDTLVIRPFVPREVYRPSKFVFTEKDGNVKILLPEAGDKKYTIKFFDDANLPALEIKQIKDTLLTLDKSNFIHAGWFKFELYEDGQLKEKHRLYIPKDF